MPRQLLLAIGADMASKDRWIGSRMAKSAQWKVRACGAVPVEACRVPARRLRRMPWWPRRALRRRHRGSHIACCAIRAITAGLQSTSGRRAASSVESRGLRGRERALNDASSNPDAWLSTISKAGTAIAPRSINVATRHVSRLSPSCRTVRSSGLGARQRSAAGVSRAVAMHDLQRHDERDTLGDRRRSWCWTDRT